MRISETGSGRSIVNDLEWMPRGADIDGCGHTPSHEIAAEAVLTGAGAGGQEFKYERHSLFGGLDFADHGERTASAHCEPSVVQGLRGPNKGVVRGGG